MFKNSNQAVSKPNNSYQANGMPLNSVLSYQNVIGKMEFPFTNDYLFYVTLQRSKIGPTDHMYSLLGTFT